MGSRLLNGSPQLSVKVTLLPVTSIVLLSTVIPGTIAGTPVATNVHMYIRTYKSTVFPRLIPLGYNYFHAKNQGYMYPNNATVRY